MADPDYVAEATARGLEIERITGQPPRVGVALPDRDAEPAPPSHNLLFLPGFSDYLMCAPRVSERWSSVAADRQAMRG